MKFHILTFGCQMNVHDSQWLTSALESRGWEQAPEDEAQVYILNTCSVREKPEQKVYTELGRIAVHLKRDPDIIAAVGGCVGQQVGTGFFNRFPFVKLVFGTDGIANAPDALERLVEGAQERIALLDFVDIYPEREVPCRDVRVEQKSRQAFVNIMQGCDNFCTYCVVPFTRGRQKSRHPEQVLEECRTLVKGGVREITLLGQNVNSFGLDKGGVGVTFAQLLYRVAEIPGLDRLRFTTSHPKDIAPEVIRAFGELDNLCPSLHLPMQAGSDDVLRRMGRKYDSKRYVEIVDGLRAARPNLALTTDLIVAFPGETEEDFEQTMEMVEKVGFESSFSFKYSDRPGVAALKMKPKIAPDVAAERLMRLQNLQNDITRKCLKKLVGTEDDVLVEGKSRKQDEGGFWWRGRDAAGRVVNFRFEGDRDLEGLMVPVRIVEAKKHSLVGKRTGDPW
ncbi:tRNA (N6-isopentenyl adenosine(37)-C2)-methylthiotransferase MiaB [Salidesulfovibrio onnuriiensis]|uniref:tRNA (N6-isopentenyl adenosine(37)-C2)-methylthiotransferase MiaB n=1 Tax=Salidesulfovibrio onnuriiensis TaxID=2583823 RepID=UPI0011CB7989|nr:tRNA (N6-isopentenyl adenosine(37)-C2)-methylthiotransferase MiaB [Salidesulfovibrio onnuriiensis]